MTALASIAGRALLAGLTSAALMSAPIAGAAEREALYALPQWVETWAASPQPLADPLTTDVSAGALRSLSGQTIRQVIRISAGGRAFRVRLTNEYGAAPLLIGAVRVAVSDGAGGIVPGTDRAVTFSGNPSLAIPAASPVLSDPFDFPVPGLSSVAVDIYVPANGNPGAVTLHAVGQQTAFVAPGNQAGAAILAGATATLSRCFLSAVDVLKERQGATVVALGDSLTDGAGSTPNAHQRWPDILAARLQASIVLNGVAVANQGLSGGRLLSDGFGPSALSRLDRDALSRPGVRYLIVLLGINDIGHPYVSNAPAVGPVLNADQLAVGYRQLIARARERGVLVLGGTLTPYQGASYHTAAGEATRAAINAFIRTSGEFDGVIDFDAAVRDPADPLRLHPAYDSGDHLHPNDAGYERMANAVDLGLFQPAGQ